MKIFGSGVQKPGWLCINLMPDRVDLSHVVVSGRAKPEVLLCDSYRKEGDTVATLKRLRRELHLHRYRCTTLLKAGDYQMVQVETPNVPAGEIKTAMRWRIKDLIDYPVESATIDALTIPAGEGAANRTPQAFAIAARNTVVAALVEPFNSANIPLEVIDIPELAQRNLAHCLEERGRGFALLAFDETGGLLTFTCDGELLQHRRMEVTPGDFVNADEEQRHQLFDRIVLELQRSLDNFDRQFHHVAVARVMVTPIPGADDLQAYMSANLDLPVAMLDLAQAMEFPNIPELREPGRQGQCLQLIGAAMRVESPA
jgi:MSHA biogenesis protein MshI